MSSIILPIIVTVIVVLIFIAVCGVSVFCIISSRRKAKSNKTKSKVKKKSVVRAQKSEVENNENIEELNKHKLKEILKLPEHNQSVDPNTYQLPFESKALMTEEDYSKLRQNKSQIEASPK